MNSLIKSGALLVNATNNPLESYNNLWGALFNGHENIFTFVRNAKAEGERICGLIKANIDCHRDAPRHADPYVPLESSIPAAYTAFRDEARLTERGRACAGAVDNAGGTTGTAVAAGTAQAGVEGATAPPLVVNRDKQKVGYCGNHTFMFLCASYNYGSSCACLFEHQDDAREVLEAFASGAKGAGKRWDSKSALQLAAAYAVYSPVLQHQQGTAVPRRKTDLIVALKGILPAVMAREVLDAFTPEVQSASASLATQSTAHLQAAYNVYYYLPRHGNNGPTPTILRADLITSLRDILTKVKAAETAGQIQKNAGYSQYIGWLINWFVT